MSKEHIAEAHAAVEPERYVDKTGTDEKPDPMRDVFQEFPFAMLAVAGVTHYGAEKHAYRGWRSFEHLYALNYHRSKIGRHLLKQDTEGEINHEDGFMLHAAAVAWNALAYLDHLLRLNPDLLDPEKCRKMFDAGLAYKPGDPTELNRLGIIGKKD